MGDKWRAVTLVAPAQVKAGEVSGVVARAAGQMLDGVDITLDIDVLRVAPLGQPLVGAGLGGEGAFVARADVDAATGQARLVAARFQAPRPDVLASLASLGITASTAP